MAEITQRLGFDAAQAITTLNNLKTALTGVNRQLRAMNAAANTRPPTVIQGFNQIAQSAQKVQTQVNAAGTALQNTGRKGAAAGQQITLSWQTMLRVVQTQVLVRSLGALINLFGESADAAQKFQLEVARIAAISEGPGSSIDSLSESLRQLSVELGVSIESVSEGAFEALQNNLGTTRQTMDLLGGSMSKLAILSGSDLKSAVNTVSPILKAYNLDITEADRVSDLLFTTIKAGVITMDELSSQLGKTVPFATQLGVSLEDLLSSIAAITLQGTDAATSQTQFRNILIKLIKPTEALAAAFEKLGVASGSELIAKTGGVPQALKAISDSVNGSEEAIARMFNTSRAAAGALNLLANSGSEQERIFKEMADSLGIVNEEFEKFDASPARRAQKATEQLNDTIRELGKTTLEIRTQFVEAFNSLVRNADDAKVVIAGLGVAVVGLGVAALAAMPALIIPALVIAGAVALTATILNLKHAWESIGTSVEKSKAEQIAALEEIKRVADETVVEQTKKLAAEIAERKELSSEYLKKVTADYEADVKAFDQRSADIIQSQANLVKNFENSLTAASSRIKDFAENSQKAVEDQAKKTQDAFQRLADFKFDKELSGLSERSQAFKLLEKGSDQLREALNKLTQAERSGNEAAIENAKAEVEASIKTNERAEAMARKTGLLGKAEQAEENHEKALEALAQHEQRRLDKQVAAQKAASAENIATSEAEIQKLVELAKKKEALLNEQADRKTTDERRTAIDKELQEVDKQAAETLAEITNNAFLKNLDLTKPIQEAVKNLDEGFKALELEGQFNLAALQEQLDSNNFTAQVQAIVQAPTGNQTVNDAISDATAAAGANANPALQLELQKKALNDLLAQIIKNNGEFEKQAGIISTGSKVVQDLTNKISNAPGFTFLSKQFQQVVRDVQTLAPQIATATGEQIGILESRLEGLKLRVESLFQQGLITEGTKANLEASLTAIEESIGARKVQLPLEPTVDPATEAAARQKLQDILKGEAAADLELIDPAAVDKAFQPVETEAKTTFNTVESEAGAAGRTIGTEFNNGSSTAKTALSGIQPIISSISTAGAIAQMNALAAAAQRALALAQAAAAAGGGTPAYFGGSIKREKGGQITRGLDTRLVAMQPGEFVVNKKSSGKFFSQLQAINGGQTPSFREQGGPVTNIGDINVSVNSAPGQDVSGRDIAIALRRELRRETSKLF